MEQVNQVNLAPLKYKDGVPDENQERIVWVRNGELLEGSNSKYGSEGNLNAAPFAINKNVEVIDANSKAIAGALNQTITNVNALSDLLGNANTTELLDTVARHDQELAETAQNISDLQSTALSQASLISNVTNQIGEPQDIDRTLNEDLNWIKSEIGQFEDEDINGQPVEGNVASGLKYRIVETSKELSAQKQTLNDLQSTVITADLPALVEKTNELNDRLGESIDEKTVFDHISLLGDEVKTSNEAIVTINEALLDTGFVGSRIVELEETATNAIGAITEPNTGLKARIEKVELEISDPTSGLRAGIENNEAIVNQHTLVLGDSLTSPGLQKDVSEIKTALGTFTSDGQPPETSVEGRLRTLTSMQSDTASVVQDMQATLGTASSGIIFDVSNLKKAVDGTGVPSDPEFDRLGLKTVLNTTVDKLSTVESTLGLLSKFSNKNVSFLLDATYTEATAKLISAGLKCNEKAIINGGGAISSLISTSITPITNSDLVVLMIGNIDYMVNTELGSADDVENESGDTFYKQLYTLLAKVQSTAPNARIVVCTGFKTSPVDGYEIEYPALNTVGKYLEDYTKAIKDVAELFSAPICDVFYTSGINKLNSSLYISDGVFTEEARTRVVSSIVNKINSI